MPGFQLKLLTYDLCLANWLATAPMIATASGKISMPWGTPIHAARNMHGLLANVPLSGRQLACGGSVLHNLRTR